MENFMRRRGFTLIELLVVISIVALLIAMLLPAIKRAREHARSTICLANERQQAIGMAGYQSDNQGYFAGGWSFEGTSSSWLSVHERIEDYGLATNQLPVIGEGSMTQLTAPFTKYGDTVWICPSDPGASVERWKHGSLGGWYHHGIYHFGDYRQYHVSYAYNTMNHKYNHYSMSKTPYGLYSLFSGYGRRDDEIGQPSTTMLFIDGSIARSWTFWVPYADTSLEQECFHFEGLANLVAVDGHAETIFCEPSKPAYIGRTDWANPEVWYHIDK